MLEGPNVPSDLPLSTGFCKRLRLPCKQQRFSRKRGPTPLDRLSRVVALLLSKMYSNVFSTLFVSVLRSRCTSVVLPPSSLYGTSHLLPDVWLAASQETVKVISNADSFFENGTFNLFSCEPTCTLVEHGSVFTRRTDLRRNPYTILFFKVLLASSLILCQKW
jgi:hypothetical protein